MEKLVLRGVMYGADKIPDSWFDKVPGGFYKSKGEEERQRNKSRREEAHRGPPPRAQTTHHSGRNKSRGRRHSDEYDDRRPRYDEGYDRGGRSGYEPERHRGHGRSRSSVDGGDDYDPYFGDRDPNHPRYRRMAGRDDAYQPYEDRYGRGDEYDRRSRRRQDDATYDPPPLGSPQPPYPAAGPPAGRDYIPPVGVAATAAGAAAAAHGNGLGRDPPPAGNGANGAHSGYIPYSNIYGRSQGRPSGSVNGSIQPNSLNQVGVAFSPPGSTAPPVGGLDRTLPGYGQEPYYDDRYPEEIDTGYVPPTRVPRHRSPSYDSYDSRPRRARSERRRPHDTHTRPKSRGKSLSRLKENFDTSQRGIGYGGVGALAGGVIGSEIGKGPIPAALGAAIGGLGANAFGARERSVDPRAPAQRDSRSRPPPIFRPERTGRREERRNADYAADPELTSRREARERARRDEGPTE